jgi:hypothetical protein
VPRPPPGHHRRPQLGIPHRRHQVPLQPPPRSRRCRSATALPPVAAHDEVGDLDAGPVEVAVVGEPGAGRGQARPGVRGRARLALEADERGGGGAEPVGGGGQLRLPMTPERVAMLVEAARGGECQGPAATMPRVASDPSSVDCFRRHPHGRLCRGRDVCSPRFRDGTGDAAGRVRRWPTRSSRAGTNATRPSRQRTTGTSCRWWVRIALRTARFNASSIRLPSAKIRAIWLELLVPAFIRYLCADAMPDLGRLDRHRPGSRARRDEPWGVR